MNCEELLAMLNDYVDGDIDPGVCDDLKRHLDGCNPCQVVVDNIRQTITLYKAGEVYPMPDEFRACLHQTLKQKWREKFSDTRS